MLLVDFPRGLPRIAPARHGVASAACPRGASSAGGRAMIRGVDPKDLARYLAISQVGLEMAAPAGVGAVLDYYLGWSPWGVIVGAVLGLTVGMIHLVQLANRPVDENSDESKAT